MKKRFLIALILATFGLVAADGLVAPQQAAAALEGQWKSKNTISIGNDNYIDNTPDDNSRDFFLNGNADGCNKVIRDFSADLRKATLYDSERGSFGVGCLQLRKTEDVNLTDPAKASLQAGINDQAEPPSCETAGEMSWLLCPVLRMFDNAVGFLDRQINALLVVPDSYFAEDGYSGSRLKQTWSTLRNLALLILVPIMLVMVIGTAIGSDMFSAYTVKKAMPRFLVAVIFIALSWQLTIFFIQFINAIGKGAGGLIAAPFGGFNDITLASIFDPSGGDGATFTGLLGPAGVAAAIYLPVVLVYAFITVTGLFLGYVLLSLRQFLVIILMLFAPLAILSWIFPGNDKLWKTWWGTFSKLLLLYPLIMVLISGGRVFAKIVQEAAGTANVAGPDGFAATLLKLIAYVGPYFFIPAVFKFAGGLFATIAGIANDKERGLFDRSRKWGREKGAERRKLAQSENLWNSNRFGGKTANKMASWTVSPHKSLAYTARGGRIPILSAAGRRIGVGIEETAIEHNKKLFQALNEAGANDKTYRVLGGMHSKLSAPTQAALHREGLLNETLNTEQDILKAANIMAASDSPTEQIAANALRSVAPKIAGMYRDPEMNYADVGASSMLGLAAHGFMDSKDLAEGGNAIAGSKGMEFAQASMVQAQLAGAKSRPDIKAGYGFAVKDGKFVSGMTDGDRDLDLISTLSTTDVAMAKGGLLGSRKDNGLGDSFKEAIRMGGSREFLDMSEGQKNELRATEGGIRKLTYLEDQAKQWQKSGAAAAVISQASAEEKAQLQARAGQGDKQARDLIRLAKAHQIAGGAKDLLIQNASRFSHASVDTKQRAEQLIHELNLDEALTDYDRNALRAQGGGHGGEVAGGSAAPTPQE